MLWMPPNVAFPLLGLILIIALILVGHLWFVHRAMKDADRSRGSRQEPEDLREPLPGEHDSPIVIPPAHRLPPTAG